MSERVESIGARPEAEGPGARPIMRPRFGRAMRQRLMGSSLLRHNLILFASNMAASAFTFLYHPIVGHLLGTERYGTIVSFGAFTLVLSLPTQVIPNLYNKFTADLVAHDHVDQVHYLLRRSTRYAIFSGVVCALLFAALSPVIIDVFKAPLSYALISSLGFIFGFSLPINQGAIQGRQQFAWFSLLNFLSAALRAILTTAALMVGLGINGPLLATLIGGVIVYALTFVPLRDVYQAPISRLPSIKPLFNYSLGAVLALSGGVLLVNLDTALAAPFLSRQDAGYYDALATMGRVVLFVGGSFLWAMFPKVAEAQQQGRPHRALLAWTMLGVTSLSVVAVVIFRFFPGIITVILHEPAAVASQLFWYGVAMMFLASSNVLIGYFLALGRMAFVPWLLACCALQAVLLSLRHGSIAQMVTVMVTVMAALLAGLVVVYIVQEIRSDGKAHARRGAS